MKNTKPSAFALHGEALCQLIISLSILVETIFPRNSTPPPLIPFNHICNSNTSSHMCVVYWLCLIQTTFDSQVKTRSVFQSRCSNERAAPETLLLLYKIGAKAKRVCLFDLHTIKIFHHISAAKPNTSCHLYS